MTANPVFRRNVSWQFLGGMGQMGLSALVLVVMARGLGASGFGIFSVTMGLVYVANSLFEPRMQDVAAKQFWDLQDNGSATKHHREAVADLFIIETAGKLLPLGALCLLAPSLARFSHLPAEGPWLIMIAALSIYLSKLGNGLAIGLLRVIGRSDLYAYCLIAEALGRLVVLTGLTLSGLLTVRAALIVQLSAGLVCAIAQWALVSHHGLSLRHALCAWRPAGIVARTSAYRRLLLANLGLSITDLMNKDLDVTLIAPLMPASEVGIYKMAKNIVTLAWRAIDPFYLAMMPEVSRLAARGKFPAVRLLIRRSFYGLFAIALLIAVGACCGSVLFGARVFGTPFATLPGLLPAMFTGVVLSAPLVWGHPLSVALDRPAYALIGSLVAALTGIAAFVLLVPRLGILGAGISWTLTFLVSFVLVATLALRRLRHKEHTGHRPSGEPGSLS